MCGHIMAEIYFDTFSQSTKKVPTKFSSPSLYIITFNMMTNMLVKKDMWATVDSTYM